MDTILKFLSDINFISLLLAFISIGLAIYSVKIAHRFSIYFDETVKKQIDSLTEITVSSEKSLSRLEGIEGKLSTKNVGFFPNHIPVITDVLKSAEKDIYIASEAGYGSTTAIQDYIKYESALRIKGSQGVKVNVVIPSSKIMSILRQNQFENWEEKKEDEKFSKILNKVEVRLNSQKGKYKNYEEFEKVLEYENNEALSNIETFSDVFKVDSLLPLNFWVADEKRAVFAIKSFEGDKFSYAFETTDKKLILSLISSWKFYHSMRDKMIESAE